MLSKEFIQSRAHGNIAQRVVAEAIAKRFDTEVYEVPNGYFPDWDIRLGNGKTLEVKWNRTAHQTGNIALEINTLHYSKADVLAVCYGNPITAIYLVPLQTARELADYWPMKKMIGIPKEACAIVPRRMFFEKLRPAVITL